MIKHFVQKKTFLHTSQIRQQSLRHCAVFMRLPPNNASTSVAGPISYISPVAVTQPSSDLDHRRPYQVRLVTHLNTSHCSSHSYNLLIMVLDTECMEKVSVFLSAKGLEKIGMFRLVASRLFNSLVQYCA